MTRLPAGRVSVGPRLGTSALLFSRTFRPALRPTRLPIQWVLGAPFSDKKRPWFEVGH
jgi:hypothetical protein